MKRFDIQSPATPVDQQPQHRAAINGTETFESGNVFDSRNLSFAALVLAIVFRSVYFTNFHIAGIQSTHVEMWADYFIPFLTVFAHLLLLYWLPVLFYRLIAILDFFIEAGLATYQRYFAENIDIHAIFSSASEGVQVVDYILELVPKRFFVIGAVLVLLQCVFASAAKKRIARWMLLAMGVIVLPMLAFAFYKVPLQKAKYVNDYTICIKLYGFYTAMAADLIFSGKTPTDQDLIREMNARNQQSPVNRIDLLLSNSKQFEDLLVIQVETLDFNLLGFRYQNKTVTPFLNGLRDHSYLLKLNALHYGPSGSSGADFQFLTGLLPPLNYPAFKIQSMDYRKSLPALYQSRGVPTYVFHGNSATMFGRGRAYKNMGVARFYDPADFPEQDARWGISDRMFFRESIRWISGANQKEECYFMITLSSHGPFDYVEHGAYEGKDIATKYFNSLNYVDGALSGFFPTLRGRYLVLMYGDHTAGLDRDFYRSRENGKEYVPGFVFLLNDGKIRKPAAERIPSNLLSGVHDIRSLHHYALDHFPTQR
jgi:phosphoglycerol transferase MdoB-like AlkP superfamily enzyme